MKGYLVDLATSFIKCITNNYNAVHQIVMTACTKLRPAVTTIVQNFSFWYFLTLLRNLTEFCTMYLILYCLDVSHCGLYVSSCVANLKMEMKSLMILAEFSRSEGDTVCKNHKVKSRHSCSLYKDRKSKLSIWSVDVFDFWGLIVV